MKNPVVKVAGRGYYQGGVVKDGGGGIVVPTVMLSGGGRSSEMLNGQRAAAVNGGGCRKEIVRIIHTANVQRYATLSFTFLKTSDLSFIVSFINICLVLM